MGFFFGRKRPPVRMIQIGTLHTCDQVGAVWDLEAIHAPGGVAWSFRRLRRYMFRSSSGEDRHEHPDGGFGSGLLALDGDTLVGYLLLRHVGDIVILERLFVRPDDRRQRVATRLIRHALAPAIQFGKTMFAEADWRDGGQSDLCVLLTDHGFQPAAAVRWDGKRKEAKQICLWIRKPRAVLACRLRAL